MSLSLKIYLFISIFDFFYYFLQRSISSVLFFLRLIQFSFSFPLSLVVFSQSFLLVDLGHPKPGESWMEQGAIPQEVVTIVVRFLYLFVFILSLPYGRSSSYVLLSWWFGCLIVAFGLGSVDSPFLRE